MQDCRHSPETPNTLVKFKVTMVKIANQYVISGRYPRGNYYKDDYVTDDTYYSVKVNVTDPPGEPYNSI